MPALRFISAVSLLIGLGSMTSALGQQKDLAALVPATYPLCITVPNVKETYARYQTTGPSRLFASEGMAPFMAELRRSGAISLCNWQGVLGFDEKLLSTFPVPAVVMAVPQKPKGDIILLMQIAENDPAVAAAIKSAETYLTSQKAVRSAPKVAGASFAIVFDTPKSAAHPELQHVYFYAHGCFGVGSSLAAVQAFLATKVTAATSIVSNPQYTAGRAALPPPVDLAFYARPVEVIELWEEKPAPKTKKKSTSQKLLNQGFADLLGIVGNAEFASKSHDIDYQVRIFTKKPPYKKGMRAMELLSGPEMAGPAWVPSGLGEYSQMNADPVTTFWAKGNWYDELEADGDEGVFKDLMDDLKVNPKGPKVDLAKELFGKLKPGQIQAVDVRGVAGPTNLLGRRTFSLAETEHADAIKDTLTRFWAAEKAVKTEEFGKDKLWWVAPGQSLFIEGSGGNIPKVSTAAVIGKYVIFGNDTSFIRQLISKPESSYTNDTVLQSVLSENRKNESKLTSGRMAVRWEEVRFAPWEAVRKADKKYDEEREVRLLRSTLTGDNTLKYAQMYVLLPPFAAIKQYLSPGGTVIDTVDDGLALKGFLFKPQPVGGPMKN